MNYIEGLRSYLVNKFTTEFTAKYPGAIIRYENVKFEEKYLSTNPVMYIRDEPVTKRQISLGVTTSRLQGRFIMYALAPEDTGTKTIRERIDFGVSIFDNLDEFVPNIGYLSTKNVIYDRLDLFRGVYSFSASIIYQCDLC